MYKIVHDIDAGRNFAFPPSSIMLEVKVHSQQGKPQVSTDSGEGTCADMQRKVALLFYLQWQHPIAFLNCFDF